MLSQTCWRQLKWVGDPLESPRRALNGIGDSGRSPWVRSEPEPEIVRSVDETTGEEVPRGCPVSVTEWGEAGPRAEGRSPLAAVLVAGDVVKGEDMLRGAREVAGREGARGGQRRPAEKERCSAMCGT